MTDHSLNLLLNYPLITVIDDDNRRIYQGVIAAKGRDFNVKIVEKGGTAPRFNLKTTFGPEIMKEVKKIKSKTIVEYLESLTKILAPPEVKNHVWIYRKVLNEYTEFTKFYLNIEGATLSSDLSRIKVSTSDDNGREHSLDISVDFDNGSFKPIDVNLPQPFRNNFTKPWPSLTPLYDEFQSILNDLQEFFNIFDEIDKSCSILDPEKPSRRESHRRIWVDANLSVVVTIDPLNVKQRPDLKFLGPDRIVRTLRENLNNSLGVWEDSSVIVGLLKVLGMDSFKMKPREECEDMIGAGECFICFSLRCEDCLPEVACDSCESFYHRKCLYEWLAANSKTVFNQLRGLCPFCKKGISCDIFE